MANYLPESFSPMGAEFKKPYMEFEFEGRLYRLEELRGGHNGRAAAACQSSSPVWDDTIRKWIVKIENNLIDIDLSEQPESANLIPDEKSFLKSLNIKSNPRNSLKSIGYLISNTDSPDSKPEFPIDCEFHMFIRVKVKGRPPLINSKPFKLEAKGLEEWPPKVGTIYTHNDTIELYPEWLPFAKFIMKPIVKILPGDETIITSVFKVDDSPNNLIKPKFLTRLINRFT